MRERYKSSYDEESLVKERRTAAMDRTRERQELFRYNEDKNETIRTQRWGISKTFREWE